MTTVLAKLFVLGLTIAYLVLLVALIAWSVRRKSGSGRGHGQ